MTTLLSHNRIDRLVVVITSSLVQRFCSFVHTVDRNILFDSYLLHNIWLKCGDCGADDSQEEQQWNINNEANEGIPVLASDSDKSVIFAARKALMPSVQHPHIIARATTQALPTFSSSASDTSSSPGEYL